MIEAIIEEEKGCDLNMPEEKSGILEETEKVEERKGKVEIYLVEEGEKGKGEEQKMSVWQESINVQGEQWFESKLEGEMMRRKEVFRKVVTKRHTIC